MQLAAGTVCRVVSPYVTDVYDELQLQVGDVVVIEPWDASDEMERNGWLKGVDRNLGPQNGKVGFFPANVVQVESLPDAASSAGSMLSVNQLQPQQARLRSRSASATSSLNGYAQSEQQQRQQQDDAQPPGYEVIAEMEKHVKPGSKVVVRFKYEATKGDELELEVDDVVVITHAPAGGWWRGAMLTTAAGLGRVGWFPANFIELLPDDPQQVPAAAVETKPASASKKKSNFWQRKPSKHDADDDTHSVVSAQNTDEEPPPIVKKQSAPAAVIARTSIVLGNRDGRTMSRVADQFVSSTPTQQAIDVMNTPSRPQKKSWKDGLTEQQLEGMSARDQKRQQVLWELYITEGAFVRDLKMVIEIFMKPMLEKRLMTAKQVELVFGNIERIMQVNDEFHKTLERMYDQAPTLDNFGQFFLNTCEQFSCYSAYCSGNSKALAELKKLTQASRPMAKFLQDCYQLPATRHLDLASYLIKPVQRICKYPLLLLEIIKSTSSAHVDRRNLEIALAKLQNVIMVINDGVDGQQRIIDIQNAFADKISLQSPTRYLVHEDNVSVLNPPPDSRQKPRQLFLFNDVMLMTKKDWRDKYHLIEMAEVGRVTINEIPGDKNMFEVMVKSGGGTVEDDGTKYVLVSGSKEQRDKWLQAWKNLCTNGIMSKIPAKSTFNLAAQATNDSNAEVASPMSVVSPPLPLKQGVPVADSAKSVVPPLVQRTSIADTTTFVKPQVNGSRRSIASNATSKSKESGARNRSYSLNNDRPNLNQLLAIHDVLPGSKARSMTDINAEDQDQAALNAQSVHSVKISDGAVMSQEVQPIFQAPKAVPVIVAASGLSSVYQSPVQQPSALLVDNARLTGYTTTNATVDNSPESQLTFNLPMNSTTTPLRSLIVADDVSRPSTAASLSVPVPASSNNSKQPSAPRGKKPDKRLSIGREEDLNASLPRSARKSSTNPDDIDDMKFRLSALQNVVAQSEEEAESMHKTISELKQEKDELASMLDDLRIQHNNCSTKHQREVQRLKDTVKERSDQADSVRKQKVAVEMQLEAERNKRSKVVEDVKAYAAKLEQAKQEILAERQKQANQQQQVRELSDTANEMENEIVDMQKEIIKKDTEIAVLTEKLRSVQGGGSSMALSSNTNVEQMRQYVSEMEDKLRRHGIIKSRTGSMDGIMKLDSAKSMNSLAVPPASLGSGLSQQQIFVQRISDLEKVNEELRAQLETAKTVAAVRSGDTLKNTARLVNAESQTFEPIAKSTSKVYHNPWASATSIPEHSVLNVHVSEPSVDSHETGTTILVKRNAVAECQTDDELVMNHALVQRRLVDAETRVGNELTSKLQDAFRAELAGTKTQVSSLETRCKEFATALQTANSDKLMLESKYAALSSLHEQHIKNTDDAMKQARDASEKLELQMAEAFVRATDAEHTINLVEQEKSEVSARLKKMMIEMDQTRSSMKTLEELIRSVETEKASLTASYESALKAVRDELEDAEERIKQSKSEQDALISRIKQSNSSHESTTSTLRSQLEMLSAAFQEKRQELSQGAQKIRDLQLHVDILLKDTSDMKQAQTQSLAEKARLQESLNNMTHDYDMTVQRERELAVAVANAKLQVGIVSKALNDARDSQDDDHREIEALKAEINVRQAKIANLESLLTIENSEVKTLLMDEMNGLSKQLQESRDFLRAKENDVAHLTSAYQQELAILRDAAMLHERELATSKQLAIEIDQQHAARTQQADSQIASLQQKCDAIQVKVDEATAEAAVKALTLKQSETKLSETATQVQTLLTEKAEYESEIARLQLLLAEKQSTHDARTAEHSEQLRGAEQAAMQIKEKLVKDKARYKTQLEEQGRRYKEQIAKLEADVNTATEKLNETVATSTAIHSQVQDFCSALTTSCGLQLPDLPSVRAQFDNMLRSLNQDIAVNSDFVHVLSGILRVEATVDKVSQACRQLVAEVGEAAKTEARLRGEVESIHSDAEASMTLLQRELDARNMVVEQYLKQISDNVAGLLSQGAKQDSTLVLKDHVRSELHGLSATLSGAIQGIKLPDNLLVELGKNQASAAEVLYQILTGLDQLKQIGDYDRQFTQLNDALAVIVDTLQRVDYTKEILATKDAELTTVKERNTELQFALQCQVAELDRMSDVMKNSQCQIDIMAKERASTSLNMVEYIRNTSAQLTALNTKLGTKLQSPPVAVDGKRIAMLQQKVDDLSALLDKKQAEVKQISEHYHSVTADNVKLKQKLEATTSRHATAVQQLKDTFDRSMRNREQDVEVLRQELEAVARTRLRNKSEIM